LLRAFSALALYPRYGFTSDFQNCTYCGSACIPYLKHILCTRPFTFNKQRNYLASSPFLSAEMRIVFATSRCSFNDVKCRQTYILYYICTYYCGRDPRVVSNNCTVYFCSLHIVNMGSRKYPHDFETTITYYDAIGSVLRLRCVSSKFDCQCSHFHEESM
jgi:hypothetical protein